MWRCGRCRQRIGCGKIGFLAVQTGGHLNAWDLPKEEMLSSGPLPRPCASLVAGRQSAKRLQSTQTHKGRRHKKPSTEHTPMQQVGKTDKGKLTAIDVCSQFKKILSDNKQKPPEQCCTSLWMVFSRGRQSLHYKKLGSAEDSCGSLWKKINHKNKWTETYFPIQISVVFTTLER